MKYRFASAAAIALALTASAHAATVEATGRSGAGGEALCLDVAGSRAASGADLILYRCHGGRNQEFAFDRGRGEIRSALGNLCVDVDRGAAFAGNRVQLWTCNGSPAQRFRSDDQGRLAFAADPRLCIDLGGRATLAACTGAAAQRFEVSTPYGDRRFDELTWLTAHNAHVNYGDARWTLPNQSRSVARQLADGVRGFMVDVYGFESSRARCILSLGIDCAPRDLYLCHGDCGGVAGITYALPRQTLAGTLTTITEFLSTHPDEIVTVFLEDYSQAPELRAVLDRVPHLRELQFDPYAWDVARRGWPRAADMVAANRRLLIVSDSSGKRDQGVAYGPDLTVENYWSIGMAGSNYACTTRWGSVPLDREDSGFSRLFVMNHFRDAPTAITAAIDNTLGNLTRRLERDCVPAARRKPNFVAVDFYEIGVAARLASEIDDSTAILFEHGGFGGRAELITPGWHWLRDLTVGNDTVSSIKVARRSIVTLFEHEGFAGQSRSIYSSSASLPDFNDRASSISVGVIDEP